MEGAGGSLAGMRERKGKMLGERGEVADDLLVYVPSWMREIYKASHADPTMHATLMHILILIRIPIVSAVSLSEGIHEPRLLYCAF